MPDSSPGPFVSILGDSISTFAGCNPEGFDVFYEGRRCIDAGVERRQDAWWQLVIDAIGAKLLVNGSFSGSMVEGEGFPAASSARRIEALSRDGVTPDIVLVFVGINDYGWGGAANQAAGRGRATPASALSCEARMAHRAADGAVASFEDAYDAMLTRIRDRYPEAQVWCCTLCPGRLKDEPSPTFIRRLRGVDVESYNGAIRMQARKHGCRLVDFASFGLDYESIDGTHPTRRGMRQLSAMAVQAMAQCGLADRTRAADSLAEAFAGSDMRSDDACDRADCLGCPFARATGNAWSLVCERRL